MNKVNFRLRSYGGFDSAQPPDIGRSRLRSITNKCTLRHRDPDPELVPERSRRGAEGSLKSGFSLHFLWFQLPLVCPRGRLLNHRIPEDIDCM